MRISHILICRTDNIGDVVLTLPIATHLKRHYPAAKIGFLCRSYAAPLVRGCSAIDYVLELDLLDSPASYFADSEIDTIIFSKPDKRLAAAAKKAGIRNRVGTSHRWYHWIYCNRLAHFSRVKSTLHEAQLNFKLLRPLAIDSIPDLKEIPPLYQLSAPRHTGQPQLSSERFNLIIHPKSNGNGREWPIEYYTELAHLLAHAEDVKLWITGSAREGKWIAENAPALLRMPNVENVCGKFTLEELSAFINAADGLIASGTGPLHMSAAMGKRTLGLFPPVPPIHPGRWGAVGARAQVLCEEKICRGCADPATCVCMRNITPSRVCAVVLQWRETIGSGNLPATDVARSSP